MNNLDKKYTDLLQDILDNGVIKEDRTGTGTLSVFGRQIRHKMSEGFPLITTKKMYFKGIVTELLWFLRGDTNIKYLVDNDCHIWNGDAHKNYLKKVDIQDIKSRHYEDGTLTACDKEEFVDRIKTDDEFAKQWGDLGPIYGAQWRAFGGYDKIPSGWDHGTVTHYKDIAKCDQIANIISDLKNDPDSRRIIVTAWSPTELDQMTLPPCHNFFQFYTRELSLEERLELWYQKNQSETGKRGIWEIDYIENYEGHKKLNSYNIPRRAISLMWNQRSVDTFLGLPFNIASYGLLLEIIANAVNMVPDELIGNLGDVHLYLNHIEQAKEQIGREFSLDERTEIANSKQNDIHYGKFISPMIVEHWDRIKIPARTREPYPLPTLKHLKTDDFYKSLSEDLSLLNHLENTDFVIENYQSHPTIKAPLSN
jgi:thymidylate synthase